MNFGAALLERVSEREVAKNELRMRNLDLLQIRNAYESRNGLQLTRAAGAGELTFRQIENALVKRLTYIWDRKVDLAMKEFVVMMDELNTEVTDEMIAQLIMPWLDENMGAAFYESNELRTALKKSISRSWTAGRSIAAAEVNKIIPRSSTIDYKARDWILKNNRFWLRHRYDTWIRDRLVLTASKVGIEEGLGRREVGRAMAKAFRGVAGEYPYYWEVVGSSVVTKARSWSAISTYHELGVSGYEWWTQGDERVCEICGPLDGVKFGTEDGYNHMTEVIDEDDPMKARNKEPWIGYSPKRAREKKDPYYFARYDANGKITSKSYFSKKKLKSGKFLTGRGMLKPQAHGGCRCGTTPI